MRIHGPWIKQLTLLVVLLHDVVFVAKSTANVWIHFDLFEKNGEMVSECPWPPLYS